MATPEELARMLQYGQDTYRSGQQQAQAPRHWLQALSGALQMGMGGQYANQARHQEGQLKSDANQKLAEMLRTGNAEGAMANPFAAEEARKYQAGASERAFKQFKMDQYKQMAPLDLEMRRAQIEAARAAAVRSRAAADQSKAVAGTLPQLEKLGIDPNSAEGVVFQLTGKLPAKAYEKIAAEQKKQQQGQNVAAGLKDVLAKAEEADKAGSLEPAIGPWQGSEPSNLVSAMAVNITRFGGEAANMLTGGKLSPTEVRSNIVGSARAIAAAMKPLVRQPGEGPWTDKDQAELVAIVGDLPTARDLKELKRRLNAVRDRIQANFGLQIPFDAERPDVAPSPTAGAGRFAAPAMAAPQIPPQALQILLSDPTPERIAQFDEIFGPGAAQRAMTSGR